MPSSAPVKATTPPPETMREDAWLAARRRHEERMRPWVVAESERAARSEKHPIYDFLFDYYSFRPSHLLRWHPGLGRALDGDAAGSYLKYREYRQTPAGVAADPSLLPSGRRPSVRWILNFLENCRDRTPYFGCFGLHEWAMVYRAQEIRHGQHPLRLPPEAIAQVVQTSSIRCSHFDAFRFFTPAARPLNRVQPSKDLQPTLDQRGCLHVNMDLYKWAFKLCPFTPSELVAEAFLLAARVREVDMRASPYDFSSLGFEPIAIETREGRAQYERHQREFAAESEPLRDRLITICRQLVEGFPAAEG